jgi:uncharacterized CHY-type Zn-finger protein
LNGSGGEAGSMPPSTQCNIESSTSEDDDENVNSNDREILIFEPRTSQPPSNVSPSLSMKVETESYDLNENSIHSSHIVDDNDISNSDSLAVILAKDDEDNEDVYNVSDDENSEKNDSAAQMDLDTECKKVCASLIDHLIGKLTPTDLTSVAATTTPTETSLSDSRSETKSRRRKRSLTQLLEDSFSAQSSLPKKRVSKTTSTATKAASPESLDLNSGKNQSNDENQVIKPMSLRVSARIRGASAIEPVEPVKHFVVTTPPGVARERSLGTAMITVRYCNNRKLHVCQKCGLEFTSGNSVLRHQEKSCLRVRVINLQSQKSLKDATIKKKCPICSSIFFNTHRLSIHIYKHHRNLLGSAQLEPLPEARRLNELQVKKFKGPASKQNKNQNDI